jgi:hypothetical protein
MTIVHRFELIVSSTGTRTVPASVLEQLNATANIGGKVEFNFDLDANVLTVESHYDQKVEQGIKAIEQVRTQFADALSDLAK